MLEHTYKNLLKFADLCFNTFISVLKILFRSKFGLRITPAGKSACSILGNGPSLNISLQEDLNFIMNTEILCVNNFIQSEYFDLLKPANYVLLDGYYFIYNDTTHNREDIRKSFEKFKTVSWPINIHVPYHNAKNSFFVQKLEEANKNIKFCYFNYVITKGFKGFRNYIFSKGWGMLQCENVLATCLYLAINKNFSKVYLFGADHSWHQQFSLDDNRIMVTDSHFYDKTPTKPTLVHDRILDRKVTMADYFLSFHKAFKSYQIIKSYADYKNVQIFNASAKSFIDSFERIKILNNDQSC